MAVAERPHRVGVDIEDVNRAAQHSQVADRFFSVSELKQLDPLKSTAAYAERFMHLWVLKEAYIKCKGAGLGIPLSSFSMNFAAAGQIELHDANDGVKDIDTPSSSLAVGLLTLRPRFRVGLCVDSTSLSGQTQPFHVRTYSSIPLVSFSPLPVDDVSIIACTASSMKVVS
mmetsp:Transcript_18707/g.30751  ORF Transcript_18707/g.30751 Transcript_18707/m.30751 type:complete len:171 (+) Transcript_18707:448-960(+)|eukprot:CAMPEP_0184645538 /NCGR_PEP_ID=MMETSP0308-20130426/2063_1 /TAXON_ID=38269 /ORGANISM="Gloeochaete witrockiana, Strain SAG 46.84" /LENGTH=170 /DNA_ID=CAMNT_0027074679 /DNA_START=376 /DNA_END=888 /DNA_ORIENTATION=-